MKTPTPLKTCGLPLGGLFGVLAGVAGLVTIDTIGARGGVFACRHGFRLVAVPAAGALADAVERRQRNLDGARLIVARALAAALRLLLFQLAGRLVLQPARRFAGAAVRIALLGRGVATRAGSGVAHGAAAVLFGVGATLVAAAGRGGAAVPVLGGALAAVVVAAAAVPMTALDSFVL